MLQFKYASATANALKMSERMFSIMYSFLPLQELLQLLPGVFDVLAADDVVTPVSRIRPVPADPLRHFPRDPGPLNRTGIRERSQMDKAHFLSLRLLSAKAGCAGGSVRRSPAKHVAQP